jgi:NAD-dependent deacetylase
MLPAALATSCRSALERPGVCLFLTGAGVSAESGIPTFRGKDGYWRIGSRNYHPEELATRAAFERMPITVWRWYLHRYAQCEKASPNPAHRALVDVAQALGERFLLVTQNVDGLHRRAGSPEERTYEVHGNLSYMRCSAGCPGLTRISRVSELEQRGASESELAAALRCDACGALRRPHVLWFDEFYGEALFRFESSLRAAADAALLVVVGTTGNTNLPRRIGEIATERGTPTIVINPEANPFSELLARLPQGSFLQGAAGHWLPELSACLRALG